MGLKAQSNPLFWGTAEILHHLKKNYSMDVIRSLQTPSALTSLLAFAFDWIVIFAAVFLSHQSLFYFGFISVLFIGSRQRALSNLVHDASHWNLFSDRRLNDWVANLLGALPMFDTVQVYRESHLNHHRYLGDLEKDPDAKNHLGYGFDDLNPPAEKPFRVYLSLLLSPVAFKDSTIGGLFGLSGRDILRVALWWVTIATFLTLALGSKVCILFIGLWMLSRATSYHSIRLFAEFSDHAGLKTGAIVGFTRNMPHRGVLSRFFHPHQDTHHLIHHLLPKVPHYNLSEMDSLLATCPLYSKAHHCDSYFLGLHSAVDCWMGRCPGGLK